MTDVPRKTLARSIRLAGLPAGHAARAALGLGRRLGGRSADLVATEVQARTAAQLFQTLGELKGGAMKLGQALSAMEPMLPAELAGPYRDTLTRLQEAAPPLPAGVAHRVLAEDLGQDWRSRFSTFDDMPAAAASIGQVHRATWRDGTEVAVKIQYPGAGEALTSDLWQLDRIVPLARLAAPAINFRQLFGQLRERMLEELDYVQEAAAQRAFAVAFLDDPDIMVPAVLEARPRVLVTAWIEGRPLADVIGSGTLEQRDRAGLRLLRLLLSSPQLLADGRLAVLEFGSSETMPSGWPPALGRLLRSARDRDAATLYSDAISTGLMDGAVDPSTVVTLLDPWMEPLRSDRFHFERSWLQKEIRIWSDPRGAGARLQRKVRIPAQHLLVQRVAFGLLGVLTSLDATVPVRAEAERWIPGLT